MLKLKFQYFGHFIWKAKSLEKTLMLGKIEGRRRRGWQRTGWLDGITDSMDLCDQALGDGEGQGTLVCCSPWGHKELDTSEWLNNNNRQESAFAGVQVGSNHPLLLCEYILHYKTVLCVQKIIQIFVLQELFSDSHVRWDNYFLWFSPRLLHVWEISLLPSAIRLKWIIVRRAFPACFIYLIPPPIILYHSSLIIHFVLVLIIVV